MLRAWIVQQFHGNTLVTDTRSYMQKVKGALTTSFKIIFGLIGFAIVALVLFVIGSLNAWW